MSYEYPFDCLIPVQDSQASLAAIFQASDPFFRCRMTGEWNINQLLEDYKDHVLDGRFSHVPNEDPNQEDYADIPNEVMMTDQGYILIYTGIINLSCDDIKCYVWFDRQSRLSNCNVNVYCSDQKHLMSTAKKILEEYYLGDGKKAPSKKVPKIGMLVSDPVCGIGVKNFNLSESRHMTDEELCLHYSGDVLRMRDQLVHSVSNNTSGLYVFRGEAGVGKSSLIQHLASDLAKTHSLIYLPASQFGLMTSPDTTQLWVEMASQKETKNIFIIEDAEALLQSREDAGAHSASLVSTLLNLSDGLLGSVMQIHVLVTCNLELASFDPALTRSGRMRLYHEFTPLQKHAAVKLAKHLNKDLPEKASSADKYTLAEIYNGEGKKVNKEKSSIGFLQPA